MCQFFSCLAFRDGSVKFTEDDSHETIISRLGLNDSADLFTRSWVRVEVRPVGSGWGAVRVDGTSTPGWWDKDRAAHEGRVLATAEALAGPRKAYNKAAAGAQKAYDEAVAGPRKAYNEAVAGPQKAYDEALRTIDGYVAVKARA
jgi:hypothetical protein